MPARLLIGGVVLVLAAWMAPHQDDPETACTVERLAFYYDAREVRDEGPETRARLVRRADSLIARWDPVAPRCAGRLREPKVYLLAMDQEYPRLIRELAPYLADPTHGAEPRTRILLASDLSLAFLNAGRTRDAAQVRYRAAGYAYDVPALIGINALNDAASTARTLGDRAAAEEYLRAAVDLATTGDPEDLGGDIVISTVVGRTYVSLGLLLRSDLLEARPGEERDRIVDELTTVTDAALDRLGTERVRDLGLRSTANGLRALALAYRGRFDAARSALDEAERDARAAGFSTPGAVHQALTFRGDALTIEGDIVGARVAHERARAEALRDGDQDGEALSLERLGRLAERAHEWDRAAGLYATAIARRESFRDRIGLDDWSALAFATVQAPYRGLVRTRLAQGRTAEAFAVLDQTRARYLRDLRDHLAVRRSLTPATRAVVDSLSAELADLRVALADAATAPERARRREQISTVQSRIEAATASASAPLPPLDLGALQRTLAAERRTLISYFIDRDGSVAFVATADTVEAVRLDVTPADVRATLRAAGSPWRGEPADPAFDLVALHRLHEMLVAPVAGRVPTERVVLVPDIEVATVPFAMLPTVPATAYEDARYLLHEWTVSTELAAALVAEPAPSRPADVEVLAFGRTAFAGDRSTWNGPDLPHVAQEIDRVTDYVGAEAFVGEAATEERFAETAGSARVLHLASHALADAALPLYSRIALAPSGDRDGTLHLYEVLEMPLTADLVVLSGCDTAGGGERDGEGIVGLQYGMRAAGAAATVATLWSVADDATAFLMDAFYDGLADGLAKDEALRRAQLAYLDAHDGLAASPFFWAAPVLSGHPAPVPLAPRLPWALLGVLVGLGSLTGLAWAAHRHRARA